MFNYEAMLKRAVEFFPRWMDIRKRYKTSTGAKIIDTFIEESKDIEQALIEYKKYYFLDTYTNEGHEDEVVAFAYKANIGTIDLEKINDLSLLNPNLEITTDIDEFFNSNKAYYEQGHIFLKLEYVQEHNLKEITYSYEDYSSTSKLVHTHIWNIFDEFACFVNIERQTNETNSQLVKRILYTSKNLPNSTEEGLKHAIVSELLTIDDTITIDDIEISTLTPENLRKPYKSFNSLLDMLAKLNRDSIKDKLWDIDDWQNEFKSLEYIDHIWDMTLDKYTDGIGSSDDLEVSIADASVSTNVELDLYKKSQERLNAYVHNKDIPKKINLSFKKYNNILRSHSLRYKIKASEALDITKEDIQLTAYDESQKTEDRKVQDLFLIGQNISKVDNSVISDNYNYRLEFEPKDENYDMVINKCSVAYKNRKTGKIEKTVDLIKQMPGFMLNAEGALVNTSVKKRITSVKDFNNSTDLIDTYNGISLDYNKLVGKASVDVSNFALNYLTINAGCEYSPIPHSIFKLNNNAMWNNEKDTIIFKNDTTSERTFEFDITANELSFEVLDNCSMQLFTTIDGEYEIQEFIGPGTFKTPSFTSPVDMKIKAVSMFNNKIRITNFLYNSYEVDVKLSRGSVMTLPDGQMVLPSQPQNTLFLVLKTYCSKQPYISGIFIGNDFTSIKYLTEIIKPLTDCDRIFDINTNCTINLHKTNDYGNIESTQQDYNPTTAYKALADDAFIRLNLKEYSSIERITTLIGRVEVFEQDGYMYHQIRLKNGETISTINISGYRTIPVKEFGLLDMIKVYINNFDETTDKVYANKITDGLIVQKNGPNPFSTVIKLESRIFSGIVAQKYTFTKLPETLETMFKTTEESSSFNISHVGPFISLNIYPKKSQEYVAINDATLLIPELSNIQIVNNFSPKLPEDDTLMVYTVEPMKNTSTDFITRFHDWNEEINFDKLKSWSIGKKSIAIKSNIDLNNSENFDMEIKEIEVDTLLRQHINIESNYLDSQGAVIIPSKYIMSTDINEATIEYKTFSGIEENDAELIKYEEIIIENDGFNKLAFSNINRILHLSFLPYEGGQGLISIDNYTLLKKEGILIWNDKDIAQSAKKVYVRYAINKPMFIKFDIDYIYKEIGYDVEAYKQLDNVKLNNLKNNQRLDLNQISSYKDADLVFSKCSTPGFEASISENFLLIKKMSVENSILVKTGYYYKNGREFYLFTEKDKLKLESVDYIDYHDVDKSGGELGFVKKTNNFVMNSEMRLKGLGEVCNIDHRYIDLKGISQANKLTACQDFNNWNSFNMNIYIKEGLNGPCLEFTPTKNYGYSFIDITDKLSDTSYLSLFADKELEIYIGKERHSFSIDFKRSLNISIDSKLYPSEDEKNKLRDTKIIKEKNTKYFLVVKGNGRLDDIIISNKEISEEMHIKNINKLNLFIEESANNGFRYKMFIKDNKGINNNGASLDSQGNIINTSLLDWGVTNLLEITSKKDFMSCEVENIHIENGHASTSNVDGKIITPAVFIDNPLTVKRLFYKINNVNFTEMTDFKVTILTSPTIDGDFVPVSHHTENIGYSYGDYLAKYVKLLIDIPKNKVIDNIVLMAEYKSTEKDAPKAFTLSNGSLESIIYDAQYSAKYRVRSIDVKDISNINDVVISIRASRNKYGSDVWLPYKTITFDENFNLTGPNIIFDDVRFFQIKVQLKSKDSYINLKNIEIEVI